MVEDIEKTSEADISKRELQRIMAWGRDNLRDWTRLCNPENCELDLRDIADLVNRLSRDHLYTLAYFVICSNASLPEVERVMAKTMKECFLNTPVEVLMARFNRNLCELVE